MAKYGFGSVNSTFNTKNDFSLKGIINNAQNVQIGRVTDIILEGDDYKQIGSIRFVGVDTTPNDISNINPQANLMTAKPLLPNIKNYPLVNELVLIFRLPDIGIKATTASKSLYYINILSLWNHPHHNALPFLEGNLQPTQQKSYSQVELGSSVVTTNQPTKIFLGKTFKEKNTVNPLLPFEGDVIYEGRWGNSIRFGSTVQNKPNDWSKTGNDGDPILILRNGQGPDKGNGYQYITEDINTDLGSIYFGSTQQIPLKASSTDYTSYTSYIPKTPNEYDGKQILVNSGRLVFNSTTDHIMLSSALTISFNAVKGFNFDTNTNFVVQSRQIKLGSKLATEPLLLGNQTVNLLNQLITNLSGFMTICSTVISTPPGTPLIQLNIAASQVNSSLLALQANLESLKSKSNYTI